ncbi:hypothetical protein [Streptomyces sp. NPDC005407]|uniref:hypothetical protein n=1 Tax=Streptomyces sp. NPDC005407 TaxID=3155340 RepID=UPI0033B6168C
MSAAEPVNNPRRGAVLFGAVIRMADHRAARRGRGGEHPVAASREPSPQQQLAETVQAMFLARGRSLTDQVVAESFGITMEAVLLMVDGALVEGVLGEEQHRTLRGMLEGMQAAPHLV